MILFLLVVGLLLLVANLAALKIAELGAMADWSWWQVLAPLWVPLGAAVIVIFVFSLAGAAVKQWRQR